MTTGGDPLPTVFELFIGVHGGAIGETCAAALIAGGIYLIVRRVISWHIPVAFVGTVLIGSFFMTGFDLTGSLAAIFSGGVGGVFMGIFYAFKSYFSAIKHNITNLFVKTICYIVLIAVIAAPVLAIVAAIVF